MLYAAEGISCAEVNAPDNSATISFIEAKPHGVLPLLDEQVGNAPPSQAKHSPPPPPYGWKRTPLPSTSQPTSTSV